MKVRREACITRRIWLDGTLIGSNLSSLQLELESQEPCCIQAIRTWSLFRRRSILNGGSASIS
ncbi:hypothetical protein MPTK1_8g03310 [Marchantia polymorpha subsp. ruderalis]|uniref:Uncharacterized protein n=1 Tax=Marchantia polymorpha TaxID=3197 RepID=A0A2R6XJ96_MARPO|nr:hypothetical protein MARPO_0012s0122 [Marchantia polymorpha]BBN18541.1 hypothetical protein Mp_8g03310 [Marchantia polymorpha subsp. ruderalis]|eukprot:PTQ46183.1 hypothetical protein MARPO_0012s0122 [Marchantia polymorpha]